jgi:GT2 family glycosyltransferase
VIVAVDHNAGLRERLEQSLSGITVVENRDRRGASGTRNAGAAAAKTPYLAFLDDDAIARAGWLERLLEPFADPHVVGTGGRVVAAWDTQRPRWFPEEFGWVVGASYSGQPRELAPVRNVWSESMAVRREVFERVGGFRMDFGKVGHTSRPEDTDLCIRMSAGASGASWVYVPSAIVDHLVPADRATFRFFLRRSFWEGQGKIEMSRHLGAERDLVSEGDYLRRTIPAGIERNLRGALARGDLSEAGRAGAIVAGIAAAGAGAALALLRSLSAAA